MHIWFLIIYLISCINITYSHNSIDCHELWDMTNKANGLQVYKFKLYACVDGFVPPNLRGTIPKLIENPIKLLNYSVKNNTNLSNSTFNHTNYNITNISSTLNTTFLYNTTTTHTTLSTTTLSTTTLSTTTLSTTTLSTTTLPPTNTLSYTKQPEIIVEPYIDRNNDTNDIFNNSLNSSIELSSTKETLINTVEDITIQIIVITASSICCCFSIISYFIYKAHRKQQKINNKVDIENGKKKEEPGGLAPEKMRYYANKLKGGKGLKRITLKNRNSWSRDNRIKPDQKTPLAPRLPQVSQPKLSVPTEKNTRNKKKLTLDTKQKPMNFKIKEIVSKNKKSFVPGSPRRRLPTPPSRAPPPPAPEFAANSLANKLDFLAMNKKSPKIDRIVRKDK